MAIQIIAEVRKFIGHSLGGGEKTVRMTAVESLATAQVEPARFELTRSGRRYIGGNSIIANGIAPVAAIPTTTATLALFNGEPTGGRSYAIERINFWLGSGTAAAGATLMVNPSTARLATAPTAMATGYAAQSASGSARASRALWATAQTFPAAPANSWIGVVSTLQLAAANAGQGDGVVDLEGAIVIPPGYALGFAILSGAGTTPLYGISATWAEIEAELES